MSIKEIVFKRRKDRPMKLIDTSFLTLEADEVYREKASEYLTSHALADFRRSPLLFRKKEMGIVKDEERPAYLVGRAAHVLILEGSGAFEEQYVVGGPVNPTTGEVYGTRTKAYKEWADSQGRPVLSDEQFALIDALRQSVHAHKAATELLSSGVAEGVVRAQYARVDCQARLDWFNPERGIVDLKTCDNIDWFQLDSRSYGYAHQVAFYRALVNAATGKVVPVWLIAVEKREPFRCGVWRMGEDVLGIVQKENEAAIERLKRCREAGIWETGYEKVRLFDWI